MNVLSGQLPRFTHPPSIPVRRFTVAEYHVLGEVGVLTEDDRVELLEGWIVEKMIHNPLHDGTVDLANQTLSENLPASWRVRVQSAIATLDSEPEPDLAVVRGPASRYFARHPAADDIALLVEVAESSLERDRAIKGSIYARAGVPVYSILNLVDRQVEVYTDPSGAEPGARFTCRRDFLPDETVPLVIEGREIARLPVSRLLATC